MQYDDYGQRELIRLVKVLEEKLTQAYEEKGITRSDAQSMVEVIIRRAN